LKAVNYICINSLRKFILLGRKPIKKVRLDDPQQKMEWLKILIPLYVRHGLKKFTMSEIAKILGVSKATLYKHFNSREQIIAEGLELKLNEIGSFKYNLFDENLPFIERYIKSTQVFLVEIAGISVNFLVDIKELYPDIWKKIVFFRAYSVDLLKQFYQQGIELGYFHDVSPTILALNDKLFFDAISDPDFLLEHNITMQQAFKDYLTLRVKGLIKTTDYTFDLEKISLEIPKSY